MGYDVVRLAVEARVSRHNDERDREDDAAWEAFQGDVRILMQGLRYRHLFEERGESGEPS